MERELQTLISEAMFNARGGKVADYIPELRLALEDKTGIAITYVDGSLISVGDSHRYVRNRDGSMEETRRPLDDSFTIQSISKVFALLYVLETLGLDEVFRRVGKEPTGDPFNASPRVKTVDGQRIPYNPLINVGAILISSLFRLAADDARKATAFDQFLDFVSLVCDSKDPLIVDDAIFKSERATGHNNRALAWQMSADGIFHQVKRTGASVIGRDQFTTGSQLRKELDERVEEVHFVEEVLDDYFKQCSILITCRHLSAAAALMANGGVRPGQDNHRVLGAENVRTVISLMSSCGMYDGSGQFAHDVGIPAKSGVGGGIMAVVPGRLGMATFAPPLDSHGNSVRGLYLLKELSHRHGLSVFKRPHAGARVTTFGTEQALGQLTREIRNKELPREDFKKADYIPELLSSNALDTAVAMCWVDKDGHVKRVHGGDYGRAFTMQSISTLFAFLYALNTQGEGIIFEHVGKEPSGEPFGELKWKIHESDHTRRKVPINPMINAGAIVIAAMLPNSYADRREHLTTLPSASGESESRRLLDIDDFLSFVQELCGNQDIAINWNVFESERRTGFTNRSLAWTMNDEGVFDRLMRRHNLSVDEEVIEDILSVYFRLCSIEVTCDDLARAAAVMANRGKSLDSDKYLILPRNTTIAAATMASSGLFNGSGEFAYAVGVPAKSGVSGGIMGFAPGQLGMAAYSPVVDSCGNSWRGQEIFRAVAAHENLSVFAGERVET